METQVNDFLKRIYETAGVTFEIEDSVQNTYWGIEPICQKAFEGCRGAQDYDEFFCRCSDKLIASICPQDRGVK